MSLMVFAFSRVAMHVMHADMRPLAPFAETNAMLGAMSVGALHLLCVAGGGLGAAALLLGFVLRRGSHAG